MKRFISIFITFVVMLFCFNALAYDAPAPPPNGTYVLDQTGKLSAAQVRQLNQKIEAVNKATQNEFGVLFLANMDGNNIEDVANATYKKWGIGKRGLDNGCLIVVSLKERKSRIETGKGVEGDVPDLKASDILQNNLNPHLKRGDFYRGFDATLTALQSQIETRRGQKADPPPVAKTPVAPSTGTAVTDTQRHSSGGCDMGTGSSGLGFGFITIIGLIAAFLIVRNLSRKAERDRREEEERLQRQLDAQRRARDEADRKSYEREQAAERQRMMSIPTPFVPVPPMPTRKTLHFPKSTPRVITRDSLPVESVVPTKPETPQSKIVEKAAVAAAGLAAAALLAEQLEENRRRSRREREAREESEAQARRERDRQESEARRRRDEDDDRRRRDEESSRSSYSSYSSDSSSSYDSGGSSGGGSDSGSGFGGGDSGGGGSSGDW